MALMSRGIAKSTNFSVGGDKPLVFLDRQNVACPSPYFLASFRLYRQDLSHSSTFAISTRFVL